MDPSSTNDTTFLFTDIEGSTELWEREPGRMARAVAGHDALLRQAIEANRGRVVKTTGDGVYAAFPDAADSLAAAIAIQRSLADPEGTGGLPLRVRCGLHAGEAERRDGDFFGGTVNRAARVMSLAYGGQVLVSQAVADRVAARMPEGTTLLDLGEVRLKGLSGTERVHQVVHASLRLDFPPLRSLESTPNNLPQQLTSFVGREREIANCTELLQSTRLLTLLGMGGLGKTRLSLKIAAQVLDTFRDGVWFVDLAPIRDPALVAGEAAKVLGVREEPGTPILDTLGSHLRTRQLLLILDNCEHLIQAAAEFANRVLRAAPDVSVLATSREALRVPGEQTYPVLPLPVPGHADGIDALSASAAVQLFVQRAQQQRPSFALTEREAPEVADLVARLEGIPLAIELAATRVRSLSIADINARLKDRYKVLTGGGRVLLGRQQTLRALVDWSYDLLTDDEKLLFERSSAFAGGFDLEAAEAVCGVDPLAKEDVIDLVASLAEKSLVLVDEAEAGTRYRMLETIRDYAKEKLEQRGDVKGSAARHCDYFFVMAKAGNRGVRGPQQAEWIARLEADHDNLRTAIAFALRGGGDPIVAVKMEVALQGFRILRGYATEGRNNIRALLALPAVRESAMAHAHSLYVGANLADSQGDDWEAERMLETCLAFRRGLGNAAEIGATLSTLAAVRLRLGNVERARAGEQEALAIFRERGLRSEEAIVLLHLGEICAYTGEDEEGRRYLEQSLAIAKGIAHHETESDCERTLGQLALERRDLSEARVRFERALAVSRSAGDRRGAATAQWWLGKADLAIDDAPSARHRIGDALQSFQAFRMNAELIGCVEDHARLAQTIDAPKEAVRLHAAAASARERLVLTRPPRDDKRWRDDVDALRRAMGDADFEPAWAEGQAWEIDAAVSRALASDVEGRKVLA